MFASFVSKTAGRCCRIWLVEGAAVAAPFQRRICDCATARKSQVCLASMGFAGLVKVKVPFPVSLTYSCILPSIETQMAQEAVPCRILAKLALFVNSNMIQAPRAAVSFTHQLVPTSIPHAYRHLLILSVLCSALHSPPAHSLVQSLFVIMSVQSLHVPPQSSISPAPSRSPSPSSRRRKLGVRRRDSCHQ